MINIYDTWYPSKYMAAILSCSLAKNLQSSTFNVLIKQLLINIYQIGCILTNSTPYFSIFFCNNDKKK